MNVPLTCRVLFFMLRVHHKQIVASRTMRTSLERIREGLWSECGVESDGEGDAIVTFKVRTKDEDEEIEILISGFDAPEIWITSCEGDVESWVVKEKISLVNN